MAEIGDRIARHRRAAHAPPIPPFSQADVFLIAYPDQVLDPGRPPLASLRGFLNRWARGISGLHLLPFFPSSSDDGFSVMDYFEVDPSFGTWRDVEALAADFRLAVDAVINHASASGDWFRRCLRGEAPYADYFLRAEPGPWISAVYRPREHPLLTPHNTGLGTPHFWTTFSADQVDLDYHNPDVLLHILRVLLEYAAHGAQVVRLDAVGYLWKEIGTSCRNLPQTHALVRIFRAVLEAAVPGLRLLTETNMPQVENLAYFGSGDEAHWVYQFPLPGLVLHTLAQGDATALTDWTRRLPPIPGHFINFLASHDGIGLTPLEGLLASQDVDRLVERAPGRRGQASYRDAAGERRPYELNISYLDALSDPSHPAQDVARFLAAHAILLCLAGVPALYFHSLVGSRGDFEAAARTGRPRTVNRQKLDRSHLEAELGSPGSLRQRVYSGLMRLIARRSAHPAFHPDAPQLVLDLGPACFALQRQDPRSDTSVICLQNVGPSPLTVDCPAGHRHGTDLLNGEARRLDPLELDPYQTCWVEGKPA
jgi:sucrose phosphorylase